MKHKILTKKEMKKYEKYLEKEAKKFKLTSKDLSNLYDLFFMIDDGTYKTIKLNEMVEWFHKFHNKIEKIVVPELHKNSIKE